MLRASSLRLRALPSPPDPPVASGLREHQRSRLDARLAILAELDHIAEFSGLNEAVRTLVRLAADNELPPHLQALVPVANARAGAKGRALSRPTLLRWRAERAKGNAALAPRDGRDAKAPAWGGQLLRVYAQPQKPSLKACLETLAAELAPGLPFPSYDQARRFLARVSAVDRQRGRMGPRELKSLRAFRRRDLSELSPLDLGLMDGHTFDAEVAHPAHGQPFRPEVTSIIDAVTRKVIGWSIALAESQHAVMDALRHAATSHGLLAILYVDRGSGYEGQVISAPVTGLLARLGTRHETSLPYNSQARGLIERLHGSLWVRAAKALPTFIGADMDAEAAKKVHRLTRAGVPVVNRQLLMPWREFLEFAERQVAAYNARPHRGLPRIRDAATGKQRYLSPDEAYAAWIAKGWAPTLISEGEAADLFRPVREVITRRGEVVLFGNLYFNRDLEHRHGERVQVAYDIHDPTRVWVRDEDGRHLCQALLDGNRTSFFPKSVVEQAREQRARSKLRRLQEHAARAQAELGVGVVIEGEAVALDPELLALADGKLAEMAANDLPQASDPVPESGRPVFKTDEDFALWCRAHPDAMTDADRTYLGELMRSPSFRRLIGADTDEAGSDLGH